MDNTRITVMKPKETAEMIGCSYGYLMKLTREKIIPHFRVGVHVLFQKDSIIKWIENGGTEGVNNE